MKSSDTIYRQDALDALDRIGSVDTDADRRYANEIFMALPSAQPEQFNPCTVCQEFDCSGCKFRRS